MASIRKEILIETGVEKVWEAVRDVGAVHQHLAHGFVTGTRLVGNSRFVTFKDGTIVRELLLDMNDQTRRLDYAAIGGRATFHHASMQVFPNGEGRSRLVWITDVLPDELAMPIAALVEAGADAIKQTLES